MGSTDRDADRRVLVAEPSPAIRSILQGWLDEWGYNPVFLEDGIDVWECLQASCPPKLVILDWILPRLPAIDLCRKLRAASSGAFPYILVLANRQASRDVLPSIEAGADEFLSWPTDKNELKARLCAAARIVKQLESLIEIQEDLRVQATCDGLTGISNRKAFLDLFQSELEYAARLHSTCGLLLLDMDRFKRINDTYGHLAGDTVLKEVANRLRRNIRPYDFVGRYGGEEFLVAIRGCDRRQLCEQAERLRLAIASVPVIAEGCEIRASVSIGAAVARLGEKSPTAVLAAADSALYQAKRAGRNRTVNYEKTCKRRLKHADTAKSDLMYAMPMPSSRRDQQGVTRAMSANHRQ